MDDTILLLSDSNKLAKTRNRMLCVFIFGDSVLAEERIHDKPGDGAAYEFMCKIDELNDNLVKYIESYSVEVRKEALLDEA